MHRRKPEFAFPDRHDGDARERLLVAMRALRTELLKAAVDYGAALAVSDGDYRGARQILEWLESLAGEALTGARDFQVASAGGGSEDSLERLVDSLRELEDVLVDPPGDIPKEDEEADWRERLERLAELGRAVEQFGVEPLGEIIGEAFSEGVLLLGAVEDSYVLSLSPHEGLRALRLSPEELAQRLEAARIEGTWDFSASLRLASKEDP
jgi:hypothetical protein